MFSIGFRMMRDKFRTFIIYSLASLGFIEMYIALFPIIKEQSSAFDEMLKSFPPEMFKAMNIDASSLSFGNLESYMSSEFLSFLWPIMAIILAITLANYISVNEIDKGTIETLASLPIKRIKLIAARYASGLILLAMFTFISIIGIVPFAALHNVDFAFGNYVTAFFGSFLFIWSVYSLAVLSSVLFSEKGKSTMFTGGTLLLMYVANIIASLNDELVNIKYLSFFEYFNGSELLGSNTYTEYSIPVLVCFSIGAMIMAFYWYNRRDLSV